MSSLFGSKTKTTTKVPPMTAQEKALINQQLELAKQQQANLSQLSQFSNDLFQQFLPTLAAEVNKFLPQEDQLTADILGFASQQIGAQSLLLQSELAAIQRGVSLSPDQEKLISDAANAAIETGLSDIGTFRDESLRTLAQETAIGRGLRPEDTPILDVGGRIVNESTRQAEDLITTIRGQEAQAKLQYPIEAGNYLASRTQAQQTLGQSTSQFIADLKQAAFNNRLNLTATTGNVGATAAQIGPSPYTLNTLTQGRLGAATTTTKNSGSVLGGIASIASGVGGLATGLGNIGLGF